MKVIERKLKLASGIFEYKLQAPLIAEANQPGQFVILRLHERGERFPITIAESTPSEGTITLVVQSAGKSTTELNREYHRGDLIADVAGPLGTPSELGDFGHVVVIGGGVGIALIYPIASRLHTLGNRLTAILGAQSADKLFYRDKISAVSDDLLVTTDDGTAGMKGFTSDAFREVLERDFVDRSWAIGPVPMMKSCQDAAAEFDTPLVVSLNTIMVDGTGMCGGCRVQVGDEAKYACVDGPEFLASEVDFDLLAQRSRAYQEEESCKLEKYLEESSS